MVWNQEIKIFVYIYIVVFLSPFHSLKPFNMLQFIEAIQLVYKYKRKHYERGTTSHSPGLRSITPYISFPSLLPSLSF